MADKSKIEWTEASWNPVTGCTKVSPGCDNCYAETFAERWRGIPGHHFEAGFDVTLRPERLAQPLRWKRPRRIFVNSMSDLFHDTIPDDYIAAVFAIMAATPQHTYQVLTKRHGRMRSLLSHPLWFEAVTNEIFRLDRDERIAAAQHSWHYDLNRVKLPLPNVWLGVSVENQQWADIRIPALLDTPAVVRWLSCEPLLGPVDLRPHFATDHQRHMTDGRWHDDCRHCRRRRVEGGTGVVSIDWVVCGGESGRGARPMHPDWARSLRDQCVAAGVSYFHKQNGEWQDGSHNPHTQRGIDHVIVWDGRHEPWIGHTREDGGPATDLARARFFHECGTERAVVISRVGRKAAGRELDGRTWDEYPRAVAR